MTDPIIPWIIAAGAALVAVILFLTKQAVARRSERANRELARARADLEEARKKESSRNEQLKRRTTEVDELRKKLTKTKKRAASAKQSQEEGGSRLEDAEEELNEARSSARTARAETERLTVDLRKLQKELDAVKASGAGRRERAAPVEKPATTSSGAGDSEELLVLKRRMEASDAKAQELRKEMAEIIAELKKAKGRAETNHRVYMVTKGELEAARDKIKTLEKQQSAIEPSGVKRRRTGKKPVEAKNTEEQPVEAKNTEEQPVEAKNTEEENSTDPADASKT